MSTPKSRKCASHELSGVRTITGSLVLQASSLDATDVRGGGEVSEIGARAETLSFKADRGQASGPQGAHVPSLWAQGALNLELLCLRLLVGRRTRTVVIVRVTSNNRWRGP